jgi:integrase
MKVIVPLQAGKILGVKPKDKVFTLFDGGGLYLQINPNGSKLWRMKYRFAGKPRLLSFGIYPEVSLSRARAKRDEARTLLSKGIDPGEKMREQKRTGRKNAANSFEAVARAWLLKQESGYSAAHLFHVKRYLERHVFPWLGERLLADIKPPDLTAVARRVESRGAIATAHRVIGVCGKIFRFGIAEGMCESDPTRDLRGVLQKIPETQHYPALTTPEAVGKLLRAIDGYRGGFVTKCALRLAPLFFVRPGELRHAEWKDFYFDRAEWSFLVTKTGTPHIVPLSRQAIGILKEIQPLTGGGRYVFPGLKTDQKPLSTNAVLHALRSLGYRHDELSGHGFRAMARTMLAEVLHFPPVYIERQLAHKTRESLGAAYDRSIFLPERRAMMQAWADYLDDLRKGVTVAGGR